LTGEQKGMRASGRDLYEGRQVVPNIFRGGRKGNKTKVPEMSSIMEAKSKICHPERLELTKKNDLRGELC